MKGRIYDLIRICENELNLKVLSNSNKNMIVIKDDKYGLNLFIETLKEYDIILDYNDFLDYIRLDSFKYIYVIKLDIMNELELLLKEYDIIIDDISSNYLEYEDIISYDIKVTYDEFENETFYDLLHEEIQEISNSIIHFELYDDELLIDIRN